MRRYLQSTALHQEIADVEVRSVRLIEHSSTERLKEALTGRSFEAARRHGKYLFAGLDDGSWLILHFGMTGGLTYFKDLDDDPDYDRLLITFANGYHLAYESQRKLGEIEVIEDVEAFVEEKDLGPDVLSPEFDLEAFKEKLSGRRGMIKPALMDQQLMSGIGNVYSDEILFQVGVHPRTQVSALSEETVEALFHALEAVLKTAIDRQAKPGDFPEHYITAHRHPDGECPRCGGTVERVKVSGRTAYYCPQRQKKVG
jgi:formamidopyrimidine-DNA glycosylase